MVLIIILGVLAYSNTFEAPFVFDDDLVIDENPLVKNISNIPSMLIGNDGLWASRPLLHVSNAINYHFGGMDTRGYHAVNLALHLLNGVLLYFLVITTGGVMDYEERGTRHVAMVSTLLFVLHPMHTEAVTYIISRSVLFSTCFFLAGIMIFVKAVKSEKHKGIYTAGLFAVSLLGMASRENFATFPAVLFLYDLFFVSKFRFREAAGHYKAHLAALLGLGYMAYLVAANTYTASGHYLGEEGIRPAEYMFTQFRVYWTYIRMLIFPVNQSIDHGYPVAKSLFEIPTLIYFLGYICVLTSGIIFARRRPVASFGALWFTIVLAPVSFMVAFLDLRLEDVIFEHRAYLPDAGIIVAAVASVALPMRNAGNRKTVSAAWVCVAALAVLFVAATYSRNSVWESSMGIWEDVVLKAPVKWRGHYNLGNEYREAGMLEKAVVQYQDAIRLNPDYPKSYNNLGISYRRLGLYDKALEQYLLALKRDPNLVETYNNLANIYLGKESYDEAINYYNIALALKPDSAEAHYNLGNALFYKGLMEKAVEHYSASIAINPGEARAHNNLGVAYLRLGKKDLARKEVEEAIRLDPGLKEARETMREVEQAYGAVPDKVR